MLKGVDYETLSRIVRLGDVHWFGRAAGGGANSADRNDASPTALADDAATPKFSTIAPADDLTNELNALVGDTEKAVEDKAEFDSQVDKFFERNGNTIALLATALGLHDQDNPVKPHAAAIAEAARKVSQASGYDATKQAVADLKTAAESGSGGSPLTWGKIAKLEGLMKNEVPNVNNKLKRSVAVLSRKPKAAATATANAATMALIAENAKLYVADTKKPTEAEKWTALAEQLRAASADVAAKVRAGDNLGATAAMQKLNQSCTDCHNVFSPEANEKQNQ